MSYAAIAPAQYQELFPQFATHAGSTGWTKSPIPTWGENPLRAGPYAVGETEAERNAGMAIAAANAGAAAHEAMLSASVTHAVTDEEGKVTTDPNLTAMRAEYTKTSLWPYLAIGGAGVLGIGMIIYAMRPRRG
jgi:hypothetical protein